MATTYHLLCVTCRKYASFGKVYSPDKMGKSIDQWTFDGVYTQTDQAWHKRDAVFGRVVESFLILHRNHELRFIPEGVDEMLEPSIGEIEPIDADDLLKGARLGDIDPDKEKQNWLRMTRRENK